MYKSFVFQPQKSELSIILAVDRSLAVRHVAPGSYCFISFTLTVRFTRTSCMHLRFLASSFGRGERKPADFLPALPCVGILVCELFPITFLATNIPFPCLLSPVFFPGPFSSCSLYPLSPLLATGDASCFLVPESTMAIVPKIISTSSDQP